jgi:Tfp pilus assembly protein PilO
MRSPFEAWRRLLWLWSLPLAFCILNLLVFTFYHSFYAGEVERLDLLYRQGETDLAALETESREIEEFLARIDDQQDHIHSLYDSHFQTQSQRFLKAIREVERLATEAGLRPTAWSYPQSEAGGLVQRRILFSVQGTYQQLRTFVNFLELTDQFLTLDGVTLSESGTNTLGIQLALSTVFTADGTEAALVEATEE